MKDSDVSMAPTSATEIAEILRQSAANFAAMTAEHIAPAIDEIQSMGGMVGVRCMVPIKDSYGTRGCVNVVIAVETAGQLPPGEA